MDTATALKLVEQQPWHHDFEIVPGVRTHGAYDPSGLWSDLGLPEDLTGRTVADVGASNGYFSFMARKRGARVVAFDFRHKDNSCFALAQHINGMGDIDHHQINVLDLSAERFGQFDFVLALGLLYHVADPYRAVTNLAGMTRHRLLVESYCIDSVVPEVVRTQPIMRFIPDARRFPGYMYGEHEVASADRSNFWGFTSECLKRLLLDAGLDVQIVKNYPDRVLLACEPLAGDPASSRRRVAYDTVRRIPAGANADGPDSWKTY